MTMRRDDQTAARRARAHATRIYGLLERLRAATEAEAEGDADWGTVEELAERAARLAELVACEPCNGTGYAAGRCPTRRERNDQAAYEPCGACGGAGNQRGR